MNPFPQIPSLTLLAEGAVFFKKSTALVVADVHLGKAASFRAHGLPIPEGDDVRDLSRLQILCQKHRASHLVIAGDLFHSPSGLTKELKQSLADFIDTLGIPLTLVLGNHDVKIRKLPLISKPFVELDEGVRIIHDPAHITSSGFHLAGHLHPVVKLPDGARSSLQLPCFLFRNHTLVLPAFGSFTGSAVIKPQPTDRIFTALREQVVELPNKLFAVIQP